jgi:hypothetical protein
MLILLVTSPTCNQQHKVLHLHIEQQVLGDDAIVDGTVRRVQRIGYEGTGCAPRHT